MLKYNNCKMGSWEEQYISVSIKDCLRFHLKALLAATSYKDIHEMGLRSHCLDSLKVILFKRFCQVSFSSILRQKLGFVLFCFRTVSKLSNMVNVTSSKRSHYNSTKLDSNPTR